MPQHTKLGQRISRRDTLKIVLAPAGAALAGGWLLGCSDRAEPLGQAGASATSAGSGGELAGTAAMPVMSSGGAGGGAPEPRAGSGAAGGAGGGAGAIA